MADKLIFRPRWTPIPIKFINIEKIATTYRYGFDIGTSVAAIKILIFLILDSHKGYKQKLNTKELYNNEFPVSYDKISHACSLSRALIVRGINSLIDNNFIQKHRSKRENKYNFICSDTKSWYKVANSRMFTKNGKMLGFNSLSNRAVLDLEVLKVFLYIHIIRPNDRHLTVVGIDVIAKRIHISEDIAKKAIYRCLDIGLFDNIERATENSQAVYIIQPLSGNELKISQAAKKNRTKNRVENFMSSQEK